MLSMIRQVATHAADSAADVPLLAYLPTRFLASSAWSVYQLRATRSSPARLSSSSGTGRRATQNRKARASRAFVDLLAAHIEKEDQILYPMAESRLSAADWDEITRRFERFESSAENAVLRQKLAPLIARLES